MEEGNQKRNANEDERTIEPAVLRLLSKTFKLREDFGLKATNARIIRTVDENSCNLRIFNELAYPSYDNTVDSLFGEKHDFFRDKLARRIKAEFENTHQIRTEYDIITGRLDIAIFPNTDTSLNPKIIGIEIKTGKTFNLRQLIRYLYKCKCVIVVRLLNQQVRTLSQDEHKDIILDSIGANIEKIDQIREHHLDKTPCEACLGCPVSHCEYRKPTRWKNGSWPEAQCGDLNVLYQSIDSINSEIVGAVRAALLL